MWHFEALLEKLTESIEIENVYKIERLATMEKENKQDSIFTFYKTAFLLFLRQQFYFL
jgi:hypothetical protein